MNKKLTEIVFILDRSGSMGHLTTDTIGGYNAFIDQQKKEAGDALVTTVLFDDAYEVLHNAIEIGNIKYLTDKEYFVRESTALLDAIGKTINSSIKRVKTLKDEYKADKVIFVIITDGYENASREFSYDAIKRMIDHQSEKYKWEFVFLGANIDAAAEGAKMGFRKDRSANFVSDSDSTTHVYSEMSKNISNYRKTGVMEEDWDKEIREKTEAKKKKMS